MLTVDVDAHHVEDLPRQMRNITNGAGKNGVRIYDDRPSGKTSHDNFTSNNFVKGNIIINIIDNLASL